MVGENRLSLFSYNIICALLCIFIPHSLIALEYIILSSLSKTSGGNTPVCFTCPLNIINENIASDTAVAWDTSLAPGILSQAVVQSGPSAHI